VVRDVVLPVVAVRIVLLAVAGVVGPAFGRMADLPAGLPDWLRVWDRWDGPHYLEIAARGYDPGGDPALSAYLPLYPALIRAGSLVLPPLIAAMLVSFLATLAASWALYALLLRDGDRGLARRAVLAMNLFPTSFALVAPYAEGLFLALSVGALLAARADGWARAGLLGLLAALARVQGWLLGPVLLVEHVARHGLGRRMWWALLVGIGPLVVLAIDQAAYGDALFFLRQQAGHFSHSLEAPWVVIGDLLAGIARHDDERWPMLYLAPLVAYALLAGVAVWSLRARRSGPAYAAYVLLALLALTSVTWPISAPRYVGAIFPVFIALADLGRGRRLWLATMAASSALLVIFTGVFAAGGWAF
jgi:hypothetical protein